MTEKNSKNTKPDTYSILLKFDRDYKQKLQLIRDVHGRPITELLREAIDDMFSDATSNAEKVMRERIAKLL
jgi:hypothetical protein